MGTQPEEEREMTSGRNDAGSAERAVKVPLPANGVSWNLVVCAASPDGPLYPMATTQDDSVQVFSQAAGWVGVHSGDGESFYLMQGGRYLSTIAVPLPYKNDCLTMTADVAQAARLIPYGIGDYCYLHLKGTKSHFTLDTRGYVTLFESLQKVNDYPWFQYFDFAQMFPPPP
jgi:hypothetical protein